MLRIPLDQREHDGSIGLLTPEVVHYGLAEQVIEARQNVLDPAYKVEPPYLTIQGGMMISEVNTEELQFADLSDYVKHCAQRCFGMDLMELPLGVLLIDGEGKFRLVNHPAARILGKDPQQLVGSSIVSYLPENHIDAVLNKGAPRYDLLLEIRTATIRVSSFPVYRHGTTAGVLEIWLETTEIMELSSKLQKAMERINLLENILDTTFEELGVADVEGRLVYVNKKSADRIGLPREELEGKDVDSVLRGCLLNKVASTGHSEFAAVPRRGKAGSIPVEVTPLYRDGSLSGAVCKSVFNDMSHAEVFLQRFPILKIKSGTKTARSAVDSSRAPFTFADIIGQSPALERVIEKARRAALSSVRVLITGESGTGKELFAHAIHTASDRSASPFVRLNCAGIPETLLESELFGYEEGAFSGARKGGKPGKFELADRGTLLLDEVGDMSIGMQSKLLRILQEGEYQRVGGVETLFADVRIIAATNRDLAQLVRKGLFREDLFYRLDVVALSLPALRERQGDVPLLANAFLQEFSSLLGKPGIRLDENALEILSSYPWPGNVRELRNALESACCLCKNQTISVIDLPYKIQAWATGRSQRVADLADCSIRRIEKRAIEETLQLCSGNKRKAASLLGISRSSLYRRLREYDTQGRISQAGSWPS